MPPGDDDGFDIFGQFFLEEDPEQIAAAMASYGKLMLQLSEATAKRVNASVRRIDKAAMDQHRADVKAALKEEGRVREAEAKKMERRDVERLKRLGERQKAAARQQLADTKQAGAELLKEIQRKNAKSLALLDHGLKEERNRNREAHHLRLEAQKKADRAELQEQKNSDRQRAELQRHTHRIFETIEKSKQAAMLAIVKGTQARLTVLEKEGAQSRLMAQRAQERIRESVLSHQQRMELERLKSAERIKLTQVKAAEDRITSAQNAAQAEQMNKQIAHEMRSVNRHKAYWSVFRSLAETGGRRMVNATLTGFGRLLSTQNRHESQSIASMRGTEERKQGILRSSYAEQNSIVTRATVRQQGIIATAQARSSRGALGGLLGLRNLALGAGGFLSARAIFGPVADFEQTRLAFEALLGSATKSERFLNRLRDFAEATPFEFTGLAQSARQLLGIGFSARDILPALEDIGGVASTLGAGEDEIQGVVRALGQMLGQGKANAEDINQITERFVGFNPRAAIAAHLGISVGEAMDRMKEGLIPANVAVEAILAGMRNFPGAAGAMERQSRTVNGRLSTLKDTITNLTIDAFSPFMDEVANAIGLFTELAESLFRGEGAWAAARSGILGVVIALTALTAIRVLDWARIAILGLNPLSVTFFALAAGLAILIRHVPQVGDAFAAAADVITSSWSRVTDALGLLFSGDFAGFARGIGSVGADIGAALAPAVDFIADWLTEAFDRARPVVIDAYEWLAPILVGAWDNAFAAVSDFIAGGGIGRVIDSIRDGVSTVAGTIGGFITDHLQPIILGALAVIGLATVGLIPTIIGGLIFVFRDRIVDAFKALPALLITGLYELGRFLGGPVVSAVFSEVGIKIMAGIAGGLAFAAGSFFFGLIDGLRKGLPAAVHGLREVIGDLFDAAFAGLDNLGIVGDAIAAIIAPLTGVLPLVEAVIDLLAKIPTPVYAAVAAFVVLRLASLALVKSLAGTKLAAAFAWLVGIPGKLRAAGTAMQAFGLQTQIANAQAQAFGSTMPRGVGLAATASTRLGRATAFLGRALPVVGTALVVGFALWEQHQRKLDETRQKVKSLSSALLEEGNTLRDVVDDEVLKDNDRLRAILTESGLSAADLTEALRGGADAMALFWSEAAARGGVDNFKDAVELAETFSQQIAASVASLDALEVDRKLTGEFRDRYQAIKDGNVEQAEAVDLLADYREAEDRARDAQTRHTEAVDDHVRALGEAVDKTDLFRDAIDRLSGRRLSLVDARSSLARGLEQIQQTFTDAAAEGFNPDIIEGDIADFARTITDTYITYAENGQRRAGAQLYEFQRQALIDQYARLTGDPAMAQRFVDSILPPVSQIGGRIRRTAREAIRESRRALREATAELAEDPDAARRAELEAIVRSARRTIRLAQARLDENPLRPRIAEPKIKPEHGGGQGGQTPRGWIANLTQRWQDELDRHPLRVTVTPAGGRPPGVPGKSGETGSKAGQTPLVPTPVADGLNAMTDRVGGFSDELTTATRPGFTRWLQAVDDLLVRVRDRFVKGFENFTRIAGEGGRSIVGALTRELRQGSGEVSSIVGGYASRLARALNPLLKAIGEDAITVGSGRRSGGGRGTGSLFGFARGGFGPRIATPGDGPMVHVWNEGKTGRGSAHGEAYIAFDPALKDRSRGIADQSVRRLGGRVEWFANGGMTAPAASFPNVTGDVVGLVPEFMRRLSTWATALGQTYTVNSGYRSIAEQAVLYRNFLAGVPGQAPAAAPGSSLHNFGLASDGNRWSGLNPGLYGLNFPMSYEPWHVQPVEGRALASGTHGFWAGMNPLPRPPTDVGDRGVLSDVGKAAMSRLYDKALDWASSQTMSNTVAPGALGSSDAVRSWIAQAVALTGSPKEWIEPLIARAIQESGGDPRAINNWDSNAAAGTPSKGLMQTIDPTFSAYKLPGYDDIWNPVHNAIAAIRYIIDRYGTPFNLPVGGYYSGGIIDRPSLVGEYGRREVVLPLENRGRLIELLRRTGLYDTIAAAAGMDEGASGFDFPEWTGPTPAGRDAPIIGEQHIHTNATDPEVIGDIAARKVRTVVAKVRG